MPIRGSFYVDEPEDDPLDAVGPLVYASVGGGIAHLVGEAGEANASAQSTLVPDAPAAPPPPDFIPQNEGAGHAPEVADFAALPAPKPQNVYPTSQKGWEAVMARNVHGRSGGGGSGSQRDAKPVFKPSTHVDDSAEERVGEKIHVARLTFGEHQFYARRESSLAFTVLMVGVEMIRQKRSDWPAEYPEPEVVTKTHDLFVWGFSFEEKKLLRNYPGLARRLIRAHARALAPDWVAALDRVESYRPVAARSRRAAR